MAHIVDAVSETNLVLSGTGQNAGGRVLAENDRVLLTNQDDEAQNLSWVVASAAWARDPDHPEGESVGYGEEFRVKFGTPNVYEDSVWFVSSKADPVVGTDPVAISRYGYGGPPIDGYGLSTQGRVWNHDEQPIEPGTYALPTITVEEGGHIRQISGNGVGEAYMDGLRPVWVNSGRVDVEPGAAYVPGYDAVVALTGTVSLSPPGGPYPRMVHAYLTRDADGNGTVIQRTEAEGWSPDADPYAGEARTVDISATAQYVNYRHVVSYLIDASGNVVRFFYNPQSGRYEYITAWDAPPVRVVNVQSNTAFQPIETWNASNLPGVALIPDGARFAILYMNSGANAALEMSNPEVGAVLYTQRNASSAEKTLPLDSAGRFQWRGNAASVNASIAVMGYVMPRS